MPAIAKGPISYVVFDEKGKPQSMITYGKGDYVHDDHHALLKSEHKHNLLPVPHLDGLCPRECSDKVHATNGRSSSASYVAAAQVPAAAAAAEVK